MFVELVTTGSELLLGEITNYNSAYLSRKLNEIGYSVIYHTTVGDNPQRMEEALKTALSRGNSGSSPRASAASRRDAASSSRSEGSMPVPASRVSWP